jgi:hypothetical protein
MIQQFSGKPVSIIGTVSKVHPAGNVIDLETSDKQHIVVRSTERVCKTISIDFSDIFVFRLMSMLVVLLKSLAMLIIEIKLLVRLLLHLNLNKRLISVKKNILLFVSSCLNLVDLDMDMYNQAVMLFQHYPQDYIVNV